METKVITWGTSLGIRIPKPFVDELNLKSGDKILMERERNEIVVKKVNNFSLDELFKGYKDDYQPTEFDFGDNIGEENIWENV